MTVFYFNQDKIAIHQGETVLDALLRTEHEVAYGCKAGVCQSCMMQATAGTLPVAAQDGLTAAQKKLGYFLTCRCQPTDDTELHIQSSQQMLMRINAVVVEKKQLNEQVFRLRLQCDLAYFPGQYVTLWRNQHLARSYSIASVNNLESFIELHIKRLPDGVFSQWLCDDVNLGDCVQLQGAMGKCFYAEPCEQPLLLVGLSTGLAPLYGIVRDALQQGHSSPIYLFVGARLAEHCYLIDELMALAQQYPWLSVQVIAQQGASEHIINGDIYQVVRQQHSNLKGFKVFVCGAESFVRKMKKQCFLAGANMPDILADAFVPFENNNVKISAS